MSTINIVIGQRLVRKLSDSKEKYFLTKDEINVLKVHVDLDRVLAALKSEKVVGAEANWETIPLFRAVVAGSDENGYKSRVGIHEVLRMTPTIRSLVIKGSSSSDIEAQARKEGMLTMLEDGVFKCVQGLTSIEEVLRVVSE